MLSKIFGVDSLELMRQDGTTVPAARALQGKKYLFLYFSASWCPPCRMFTPQLAAFHESFHVGHNFDVVYVSQDRDERSMLAYFYNPKFSPVPVRGGEGSHGDWLAVPYAQAKTVGAALMRRYAIMGIPTLYLFDLETGELLTKNARNLVAMNLKTANGFPWSDKDGHTDVLKDQQITLTHMSGLTKYLPSGVKLLSKAGPVNPSTLAGKTVFFYFSASWCPPCRGFTPQLAEFYDNFHESKNFEVVLVTWDEAEDAFKGYFAKMPWLAIPFENNKEMDALRTTFNVESIPTLIGVNADTGAVVTTKARERLVKDPEGTQFPWSE